MSAQQVVFQYLSAGSNTLTVPPGFSNQVLVYAWGAGGGAGYAGGGAGDTYQRTVTTSTGFVFATVLPTSTTTQTITVDPGVIPPPGTSTRVTTYGPWIKTSSSSPDSRAFGGGGGFVEGILTVSSGDTVVISVGGAGGVGPRDGSGIGGIGDTPAISFNGGTTGVGEPTDHNDDQNYGAGGGGGAATSVLVNGVPMIVAAGGGGGGGGRSYQTGSAGSAGGVATATSTTPRGGTSPRGYSVGGGGGAGYPLGGAGGQTFGDDAGAATGGYGGQNYANASVTSSTLTAGSGITPGGATNALYPRAKRGYAGYDGAVIVIFTKSFQAYVKDTDWKLITNAYVKIPSSSKTLYRTIPPTANRYENSGTSTFVVPPGVFSIDASVTGGGGGGGGGGYGTGGEQSGSGGGGGSGYTSTGSISVTPGETLTVVVGAGGLAGASHYSRSAIGNGGNGGASTLSRGASVLLTAAAGNGGTGGLENQTVAGGTGFNNGSVGLGAAGTVRAGGNGGASTLASGAVGVASTSAPGANGSLGSGGAGGPASDSPDGANNGGRGGTGYITLSYSSDPVAEIVTTGGWTPITQAWIKDNNEWKSIQSGISLVPIPSTAEVVTINLTIAANANNYVLSDFLSATSYYPGRSIVNLTVNAGVIVGSGSTGTPALIIDGLVSGDLINLINNGNIAGAGGQGGAAGQYTVTNTPIYDSKGNQVFTNTIGGKGRIQATNSTVTSVPGRPGEIGGPALYVTYLTNLVNNGTIAGGGGGGGGGGGSTGGSGGGGAGSKAGSGANNGTLTAGGAGAGLGGQGGARGTAGSAGTNSTNAGGVGGQPGIAILGIDKVAIITAGTIIGERKVIAREAG